MWWDLGSLKEWHVGRLDRVDHLFSPVACWQLRPPRSAPSPSKSAVIISALDSTRSSCSTSNCRSAPSRLITTSTHHSRWSLNPLAPPLYRCGSACASERRVQQITTVNTAVAISNLHQHRKRPGDHAGGSPQGKALLQPQRQWRHNLSKAKGSVLATKSVETQGKGSVLATNAVERQGNINYHVENRMYPAAMPRSTWVVGAKSP